MLCFRVAVWGFAVSVRAIDCKFCISMNSGKKITDTATRAVSISPPRASSLQTKLNRKIKIEIENSGTTEAGARSVPAASAIRRCDDSQLPPLSHSHRRVSELLIKSDFRRRWWRHARYRAEATRAARQAVLPSVVLVNTGYW